MAKVPMKRIFICGLKRDRKQILEKLQMEGMVQIENSGQPDEYLKTMDVMPQKILFDKNSNVAEQALGILTRYAPEKKSLLDSFEDAKELGRSEYDAKVASAEDYLAMAEKIISLEKEIRDKEDQFPKLESRIDGLKPWVSMDLPLNYKGTDMTEAFIGSLPYETEASKLRSVIEELAAKRADENETGKSETGKNGENLETAAASGDTGAEGGISIPAVVDVISSSPEMSCVFILSLKKDSELMRGILKELGFSIPKSTSAKHVPREEIKKLLHKKEKLTSEIAGLRTQIADFAANREELKFASDYYAMRAEKYSVLYGIPQSESAFFIEGYVPAAYGEVLCDKLRSSFDVEVELSEPGPEEDVPVLLRNGAFSEPVETVVESYSLPGKQEIDPSRITSIFYYIFFGMMLSDAGYGILLTLGTAYVMLKVKNMKPGMKKMMELFFYGGISTIVWGLAFGSFFGNAVNVIAATFFGRPDITLSPLWFEPMSEPMRFLVFAFACGIVHILTGLGIKLYQCIKQGDYVSAFCDSVLWFMFVGGGIVYLLSMPMVTDMLGLGFSIGHPASDIAAWIAIAGCIGVVLTGGRESKNWFKRLLKGAYAAYGITGYLSDILSYSRLLALGLATGVIAQVFNQMGSMLGATWYGALIFIIIFLIGHILNIGINVLGAYVHTNRLQFVEFFGKFYDGGGRSFEPFTEKTKYFKVKEDK